MNSTQKKPESCELCGRKTEVRFDPTDEATWVCLDCFSGDSSLSVTTDQKGKVRLTGLGL